MSAIIAHDEDLEPERYLAAYSVGTITQTRRASHGIENYNAFVTAEQDGRARQYVLTVLVTQQAQPAYISLLERLAHAGLPVAVPIADTAGKPIAEVGGQQVLLQPRLSGQHTVNPTTRQIEALGRFVARMHNAGDQDLDLQPYPRDAAWLAAQINQVAPNLAYVDCAMAEHGARQVAQMCAREDVAALPTGLIHGDIFRDNVLFNSHGLTGVIDFHHASVGYSIYDLAVIANDWCTDATGTMNLERTTALLRAYHRVRPLKPQELWFFPMFASWAALAFWLSRAVGVQRAQAGSGERVKDPEEFRRIFSKHMAKPVYLDPRLIDA